MIVASRAAEYHAANVQLGRTVSKLAVDFEKRDESDMFVT